MAQSEYQHCAQLLRLLKEKNISVCTIADIMLLSVNFEEQEQKEEAAKKLYPIIEKLSSDEEVLTAVEEIVEQSIYYNRERLLNLLKAKKFSSQTIDVFLDLFEKIKSDLLEDTGRKLYQVVENCNTEDEALKAADEMVRQYDTYRRERLLDLMKDRHFSFDAREDVMNLIRSVDPEDREETAQMLYPIVGISRTEEEAVSEATEAVVHMKTNKLLED